MKVVVFSGAGMSAESGISTFRDTNGLWEQYKIEEVATPEAWNANPELVTHFYNLRRRAIVAAQPNQAHRLIAQLEQRHEVIVVTQNIGDLHERAGSSNVLHLHGNIRLAKSSGPNKEKKYYPVDGDLDCKTDFCEDGYSLRPHVVWFGEDVPNYLVAQEVIQQADVLIVIGTSLQVYPAAGLIHEVSANCKCFLIDPHLEASKVPNYFHVFQMEAGKGMEKVIELL